MEFHKPKGLSNSNQENPGVRLHFLSSDDNSFEEDFLDNHSVGPSESESFISASDQVIISDSESDTDIINELELSHFLHKKEIQVNTSNKLTIIQCNKSYSEDDCEAINTDLPETNLLDEIDKIDKEMSNSFTSENSETENYSIA